MENEEFFEKAREIINTYEQSLAQRGIKCTLSKRYFETDVRPYTDSAIENAVGGYVEKKKYLYQKNRYHSAVLTFMPLEKGALKKDDCKEYSFLLRKVERVHIGLSPEKQVYKKEKVFNRIEKRILKILKKSEACSAEKACKNDIFDAFRYVFQNKYDYKKNILGKSSLFWMRIFNVVAMLVCIGLIILLSIIF